MGLLLGEVTWGEHAVFPHNKGMKGKRFDWLLEFGFNWLYFYHRQHSKQPVWAEGCWLVKVHFFAFFYLFRAVQYKSSTRSKQDSLLRKAGDRQWGRNCQKSESGSLFLLWFPEHLFSRCPTAASEKAILFCLFAFSLDYLCRGVEHHFQALFNCRRVSLSVGFTEHFLRDLAGYWEII